MQTFFWDLMRNNKYFWYKKGNIFNAVNATQYHARFVNSYQIKLFKKEFPFQNEASFYSVDVTIVKETQMKSHS